MKHAVIVAHPNPDSLTLAIAHAYADALGGLGHEVLFRDLYRMGFDPCLKAGEVPGPDGCAPAPDAAAERALLEDVEAFAFVYPLWFNAPPAILKGYADRIFSLGFGYTPTFGGSEPRLTGRSLVSLTTSGAPDSWVRDTGVVEALRRIFDDHFAEVCGLSVLEHFHMGGVVPGVTPDAGEALLDRVRDLATRRFGPPSSPP